MKTKLAIIKTFILIVIFSVTVFFACLINASIEFLCVEKEIKEFVERGEFYIEIGNTKYYKVSKKYEYEDVSKHIYSTTDPKKYVGSTADILSTTRNPLSSVPFIGFFSRIAWVGHSALIMESDGSKICEVVGNEPDPKDNFVRIVDNRWISGDTGSPHIVALRVKNLDDEDKTKITDYATLQAQEQDRYNFFFPITQTNKYYCTDLVSRSINQASININYDGFMTTGNDMILSKHTYIIFYRVKVDDKFLVYYLTDEVY